MADILHEEVIKNKRVRAKVGQQLLEIITSGMYDNPLMVYREYIQNAVDSIDNAVDIGLQGIKDSYVRINIDGRTRTVVIEDNGTGVSNSEAESVLGNLGFSSKEDMPRRGFRGIGRLGGLSYCDLLRFETRSFDDESVAAIEWDNRILSSVLEKPHKKTVTEVISEISSISFREPRENELSHFFRVELINVRPFHNNKMLSPVVVGNYLSQTAPVPFNPNTFTFGNELDEYLSVLPGYRSYNIFLDEKKIFRAFKDKVEVSKNINDTIRGVELFEWVNNSGKCVARGWYANTSFKGALPTSVLARGIRVRQGNIEVGDERFLEAYFTEKRFAIWHIGEIHVLDHCVKQNARRDGFEQSPEYECFLEHAFFFGRYLSTLCRKSSIGRNKLQRLERLLVELEEEASKYHVFIDEDHFKQYKISIIEKLECAIHLLEHADDDGGLFERCNTLNDRLGQKLASPNFIIDALDGRSLRHKESKELFAEICTQIADHYNSCNSAGELIERISIPYLKNSAKKHS